MVTSKRWTLLAAAVAVGLGVASVRAAEPTARELMDQVKALQAKVEQLEARPAYNQKDVDATVAHVLQDADHHSMLVDAGGVTSGYNPKSGFFISNEDGSFLLHPSLLFQARYTANWREKGNSNASGDDWQSGFEVRRMKFIFDGNAFSKDLTYKFQWKTDPNSGSVVLDDAYAAYKISEMSGGDVLVKVGQYKLPVFKEETMADQTLLTVDRSLANGILGGNIGVSGVSLGSLGPRSQGVSVILTGANSPIHGELMFHDGAGSVNTDFQDTRSTTTVSATPAPGTITKTTTTIDFGLAGRLDYKVMGNWDDTKQFSARGDKENLLVVGAGMDWTQGQFQDALRGTVDAQFATANGLSVYGALYGDYIHFQHMAAPKTHRYDWGGLIQAGYLLSNSFEVFGRWDFVCLDHSFKGSLPTSTYHELTAGINYFLGADGAYGHHAKISVDIGWLPSGSPVNYSDANILSNSGKHDEVFVRAQFQLWI